jgi:hypothetical protein
MTLGTYPGAIVTLNRLFRRRRGGPTRREPRSDILAVFGLFCARKRREQLILLLLLLLPYKLHIPLDPSSPFCLCVERVCPRNT